MDLNVIVDCIYCRKRFEIKTTVEAFNKWQHEGVNIQDAMPELNANERELLMSNICPECWNKIFPPEEEEKSLADETKKGG